MTERSDATNKAAIISALDARAREADPFTFLDMSRIAQRAGGTWNDADRYIQRRRKRGEITFVRVGRDCLWTEVSA